VTRILHIDFSPRSVERSHSSKLTRDFVTTFVEAQRDSGGPEPIVTYRNLGVSPVPLIDEAWIGAAFTAPEARTSEQQSAIALSDALIDDLYTHDLYVFGVPMYNFGVTGSFKAYIDQIVRVGRTFGYDPVSGPMGLLAGKRLIVLTARGGGGYGPGEPREAANLQDPYIRAAFGLVGVTDITFIHGNNLSLGDAVREQSLAAAHSQIQEVVTARV